MIKKILLILVFLFSLSIVHGAMDPTLKECLQRDYTAVIYDGVSSCNFPDGASCSIDDFNTGICGSEFMIEDYCVKEGLPVWDKELCCEGLISYIKPNMIGQTHCTNISFFQRGLNNFIYRPVMMSLLILLIAGLIIIMLRKKK